jgi:hypothetical protein
MPAIQAVLRSQVALAAKGNGPAQRALIEVIQTIEREIAKPTHQGDLPDGIAERLDAALKRVDDQSRIGSSPGASHTAAARSARTR